MKASIVVIAGGVALAAIIACADLVGIGDLPSAAEAGDVQNDTPPPNNYVCSSSTTILTTTTGFPSTINVANNFVYGGGQGVGIFRCATTGVCNGASDFVNITPGNTFESYAVAPSSLYFTLQGATGDAGSVHSAALDGTGEQTVLSNQTYPSWMASSGSRTFWVEDTINGSLDESFTPSVVHCIGCSGPDTPWITNLNGTYGLIADANDVYVLAEDGSAAETNGIYGCSVQNACGNGPRIVTTGLDEFIVQQEIASDGTNVRVCSALRRQTSHESILVGNVTLTRSSRTPRSLRSAADGSTNDLFFATDNGLIETVKADGSGPPNQALDVRYE